MIKSLVGHKHKHKRKRVMDIARWGPAAWVFMASVAMSYPTKPTSQQKADVWKFYHGLGQVLPCVTCRHHFLEYMDRVPIKNDSRDALFAWVVHAHNEVRARQGKAPFTITGASQHYSQQQHPARQMIVFHMSILLLVVFGVAGIVVLTVRSNHCGGTGGSRV